jgi:diguanylate cyclase (GGDEF)-like protein/PAS domain S-box-containing protein
VNHQNTDNPVAGRKLAKGLPGWVFIILFGLVTLILILAGYVFFQSQSQIIRTNKYNELKFIAELKVNQIVQWREERLIDVSMNTADLINAPTVRQWLDSPEDSLIKKAVRDRLQLNIDLEGYHNAILTTPSGRLLLSLESGVTELEPETRQLVLQVAATGKPVFGDFYFNSQEKHVFLDIIAPIFDDREQIAAILILRVDPKKYLYPLIQSWPTPSKSAETLLVRKDGESTLFLNPLRHADYPPLTHRIPLSKTDVPSVQALLGKTGAVEGLDYRGVQVVAEILPVPGTSWFMISKVDSDEILAEVNNLGLVILLLVGLSILMTAALAAYLFNFRQRHLFQNLLKAEQERSASQLETRTILYCIGDGVIATDAVGRVTHLNPVAENLTGWKESEALGRPMDEVFHIINEKTREPVENPVTKVLKVGTVVGLANHTLLISRDGTERPIADSGAPIRNENNQITGVVLVFRDQTEERRIQKERALLTDTISASLNEIYLFDCDTYQFRSGNTGALHNLGYTLEQLQQLTPLNIKSEFTHNSFQRLLKPLLEREKPLLVFETVHRRADGSLYPVESHLQLIDQDGDTLFLEVVQDISERRQVQEALRLSEERHRLLADNAHDVIWTMDLDGQFTYVSPSVFALRGYTPEEVLKQGIDQSLTPESAAIAKKALQDNLLGLQLGLPYKNMRVDLEQPRKDGSTVWTEVSVSGMYNEAGEFIGMLGVTRDISGRRLSDQKLAFRLRFEELLSHISTRFINLDTSEVDSEINLALKEIGTFIDIDRGFVFLVDHEQGIFSNSHEWCRPGIESRITQMQNVNLGKYPTWLNKMIRNEAIILQKKKEIDEFLGSDTSRINPEVHTLMIFPLWMNQKLQGCVGFDSENPLHEWGPESISMLQQFSNILSNALERTRLVAEIEKRAVRDELTGAYNRRGFAEIGEAELTRANRYKHPLGMLFFDIDRFKMINDTLGHVAGDEVLKEVSRRCYSTIRELDVFCRWGGDEFVVLLPESSLEFACQVGHRLRESISDHPFMVQGNPVEVTISVGITGAFDPDISLDTLLRAADKALYSAKQAGKNHVFCGELE